MRRFGWPVADTTHLPLAIAHRGASSYETGNTLPAFRLASELFAEMWEVDVRLSDDGVAVATQDDDVVCADGGFMRISKSSWAEIRATPLAGGHSVPRMEQVCDLAGQLGAGLYLVARSSGAAEASWKMLADRGICFAAIGSDNAEWIARLRARNCPYPLSVLVPDGGDTFEYGADAAPDMLHVGCRHVGPVPRFRDIEGLRQRCLEADMALVLCHQADHVVPVSKEGPDVLGISSSRPECLKPSLRAANNTPEIVCHRGASFLAPENTLAAAEICVDQGLDWVEVDVRTTADDCLVVIHDVTVDRTTNGSGAVSGLSREEIRHLDAGSWFSPIYAGAQVPLLAELLDVVRDRAGLYIEIKKADPEQVLREVSTRNMLDQVFFSCMELETMRRMRALTSNAMLMAPRWMYPSLSSAMADFRANIIEFELGVDNLEEVLHCREMGARSMIYSLTGAREDLQRILESAPDMVNLDRPDLFKILASYPGLATGTQSQVGRIDSPSTAVRGQDTTSRL